MVEQGQKTNVIVPPPVPMSRRSHQQKTEEKQKSTFLDIALIQQADFHAFR